MKEFQMKLFLKSIKLLIVLFVMGYFLITVREVRAETGVLFDGLSFRVGESKDLKYAKRQDRMIILCPGGDFTQLSIGFPVMMVGSNENQTPIKDLVAFSKERIKAMKNMIIEKIVKQKKFQIDGFEAYEIEARAKAVFMQMPMRVYQVIISKGKTYYLIQGMVSEANIRDYIQQFRTIAYSVLIDQN